MNITDTTASSFSWAENEFAEAALGDARRTARLVELANVLADRPTASLPQATDDPAMLKAAYRFFDNDDVHAEAILASHVRATTERIAHVPLVLAFSSTPPCSIGPTIRRAAGWDRWPRRSTRGCWRTPRWP